MMDPKKAKDELESILETKEYQVYFEKNIIQEWWDNAKNWLAEQLSKLFPSFEMANSVASPLLIVIILVVILLIGLAITLIVRNRIRRRKYRDYQPLEDAHEIEWSYKRHLSVAEKYEREGNLKQATRHLFLGLLLLFHEIGWLEAKIWKTNWEYYEEMKKVDKDFAKRFFRIAHFFDEVTYGDYIVQNDEYVQYKTDILNWLEKSEKAERA